MISKKVVEDFLNKKLYDWSWIKDTSREKLLSELGNFNFKTEPYTHQLAGILLGIINDGFLYFLDMGLGKTLIVLDVLTIRREEWKRALVLSPNISTVSTWSDEVEKHSNLSSIELIGNQQERWELLKKPSDLVLLNYTGLLVMTTDPYKGKWVINKDKLKVFLDTFDVIIYDEIHQNKNRRSLSFEVSRELSKKAKIKFGLTGTPMNRDPLELWPVFYLVDNGETLGEYVSIYREAYFDAKPGYWGGIDYKLKKELKENLNQRLLNKSIRYSEKETLDLPEKVNILQHCVFCPEQKEAYQNAIGGIISAKGNLIEVKNAFIKFRQICSGYIEFTNEDGEKIKHEFDENPKLDALVDLIKNMDGKVVVFLEYIKSGDIVCERLEKEKIKFERLYGGTKDKIGVKNKFISNSTIKVLVANVKSGGTGLNLQVANYMIYFESASSLIDRQQSEKRIHRIGQTKRTFIYDLVFKNSIEERILSLLKEGKDIFRELIEMKNEKGEVKEL
jgi:SNF2 family DNA or RNA helicase